MRIVVLPGDGIKPAALNDVPEDSYAPAPSPRLS